MGMKEAPEASISDQAELHDRLSGKTVRGHAILVNFHTNLSLVQSCVYNPVPIEHRGITFGLVLYEAMGL